MYFSSIILLTGILNSVVLLHEADAVDIQKQLTDTIMGNYDPTVRPVKYTTTPTHVNFSFWLQQVIDVDERLQIFTFAAGLKMNWKDEHLIWDPAEYVGIEKLWNSSSKIWTPPIGLWNNAESNNVMTDTILSIDYTGTIQYDAPVTISSFCKIDFFFFPLDEQICVLEFGPFIMDTSIIQMHVMEGSEHINSDMNEGEFIVHNVILNSDEKNFTDGFFSYINVVLHLQRQPQYYLLNLLIPCLIIFCISFASFSLPPDSGEKISLCVTILLSMALFLGLSSAMMPPTSGSIPLIAQYSIISMVLVAICTGMSVAVLRFWHRGPAHTPVSPWMRKYVLGYMVKMLRMEGEFVHVIPAECRDNENKTYWPLTKNGSVYSNNLEMKTKDVSASISEDDGIWLRQSKLDPGTQAMINELKSVSSSLKFLVTRKINEEHEENVNREWKQVAIVMNRFFMYVFSFVCVGMALYFIIRILDRRDLSAHHKI